MRGSGVVTAWLEVIARHMLTRGEMPSRTKVREPQGGRASHDVERQPARQGSAPTLRFGPASLPQQDDHAPDPGPPQDGDLNFIHPSVSTKVGYAHSFS